MPMCGGGGPAVSGSFRLSFRFEDKALPGATVQVRSGDTVVAQAQSGADGVARVMGLAPGDYWLEAEKVGIRATTFCFHVPSRWTPFAARRFPIRWGEFPTPVGRAAGRFVDSQPGTEGGMLERLRQRTDVPIAGARLRLLDPLTGRTHETTSGDNGAFAFPDAAAGTYVLHMSGGSTGRPYDPANMLVRVGDARERAAGWQLVREDYAGGACSDHGIRIRAVREPGGLKDQLQR